MIAPPKPPPAREAADPLEALIKEARLRARRRRLLYTASTLAVAAFVAFALIGRGGGHPKLSADALPRPTPVGTRSQYGNGLLVVESENGLVVVRRDGSDARKIAACGGGEACKFLWYAWSPDGSRLA